MAKNVYIGISSKAKNVKNLYIGLNGKSKKIKKGYIGINNIARLFYEDEPIFIYNGEISETPIEIESLTHTRTTRTCATKSYVFAAGGNWNKSDGNMASSVDTVDVYNSSCTHSLAPNLTTKVMPGIVVSSPNKEYCFALGGRQSSSGSTSAKTTGDVYNNSLTRVKYLSYYDGAYTVHSKVGNLVLIAVSGKDNTATSDSIRVLDETSLTFGNDLTLPTSVYSPLSSYNSKYAIFAGGLYKGFYDSSPKTVDNKATAFDSSGVLTNLETLSKRKYGGNSKCTEPIGNRAAFLGGDSTYATYPNTPTRSNTMELYDSSLTHSFVECEYHLYITSTTAKGFSLIPYSNCIDIYDSSLTKKKTIQITNTQYGWSGTETLGNYVFLVALLNSSISSSGKVCVLKIN